MGRHHRKRSHADKKKIRKSHDTKRRTRDHDQVHQDLIDPPPQPLDDDLPGRGQFYCIPCARHFIDQRALETHLKSKQHKKTLKAAQHTPWTQLHAEAAVGLTTHQ